VLNRLCELFPSSLCGGWLGAKAEFTREHLPEIHIEHPADLTMLIAPIVHEVATDEAKRQSGLAQLPGERFNGPHKLGAFGAHDRVDCLPSAIVHAIGRSRCRYCPLLQLLERRPCGNDAILCVEDAHASLAKIVDGDRRTTPLVEALLAIIDAVR
jgi:hypothetical protein